jgi:hypothetical protein
MSDILTIAEIAATAGIVAAMAFGLRWFLGDRGDTWTSADMQQTSSAHGWPVGVQEEEPFRWHVEALAHSRPIAVGTADRTSPRAPTTELRRTALS